MSAGRTQRFDGGRPRIVSYPLGRAPTVGVPGQENGRWRVPGLRPLGFESPRDPGRKGSRRYPERPLVDCTPSRPCTKKPPPRWRGPPRLEAAVSIEDTEWRRTTSAPITGPRRRGRRTRCGAGQPWPESSPLAGRRRRRPSAPSALDPLRHTDGRAPHGRPCGSQRDGCGGWIRTNDLRVMSRVLPRPRCPRRSLHCPYEYGGLGRPTLHIPPLPSCPRTSVTIPVTTTASRQRMVKPPRGRHHHRRDHRT
jgi:hypothetical protein